MYTGIDGVRNIHLHILVSIGEATCLNSFGTCYLSNITLISPLGMDGVRNIHLHTLVSTGDTNLSELF